MTNDSLIEKLKGYRCERNGIIYVPYAVVCDFIRQHGSEYGSASAIDGERREHILAPTVGANPTAPANTSEITYNTYNAAVKELEYCNPVELGVKLAAVFRALRTTEPVLRGVHDIGITISEDARAEAYSENNGLDPQGTSKGRFSAHDPSQTEAESSARRVQPTQQPDGSSDYKLRLAKNLAIRLIVDGHVDANNEAYDGVRALYQLLNDLPVTGFHCHAIEEIEQEAQRNREI